VSTDEIVAAKLTDLTKQLKAMPDPHSRVVARYRRSQRRRLTAGSVSLVIFAAAATGTVTALRRFEEGPAAQTPHGWEAVLQWAQRLADSPTRGSLAADKAFLDDLTQLVAARQRSGAYPIKDSVTQTKVIFAGDIGPHRVSFVAFQLDKPAPGTDWLHRAAWFVAPNGATPQALSQPEAMTQRSDGLEPTGSITIVGVNNDPGRYHVSVAPASCGFASAPAPLPEATGWQPETTGSFLLRTPQTERSEWWRITCDGVVRSEQPSETGEWRHSVTESELDQAIATSRTPVDRALAQRAVSSMISDAIRDTPRVVWAGRISGTEPDINGAFDGAATLCVAQATRGNVWVGELAIAYDQPASNGLTGTGQSFTTSFDPTSPTSVIAIRLGQNTSNVFVLAPTAATHIRAVDSKGKIAAEAQVSGAAALLRLSNPDNFAYEAIDDTGKVIGRATLTGEGTATGSFSRWDQP